MRLDLVERSAPLTRREVVVPTEQNRFALEMAGFPDRQSVAAARRLGIHTVILDPRLAAGTAWAGAAGRPVAGLAIRRTQVGRVLVYSL